MNLSKRAQETGIGGSPGGPGSDISQQQQTNQSIVSLQNQKNKEIAVQQKMIREERMNDLQQDVQQGTVEQMSGILSNQMKGLQDEIGGLTSALAADVIPELNTVLGACIGRGLVKEASLIDEVIVALKQLLSQARVENRDTSNYASQLMALVADFGLELQEEVMKEKLEERL